MKQLLYSLTLLLFISCSTDDTQDPVFLEQIFVENPERVIKVNIIYVEASETRGKSSYSLNEQEYIDYLNGYYFHRLGIGLELNESKILVNAELYDLRDNVGSEPSTFFTQTQESYQDDTINIYIMKRSNIVGILGMGRNQRVLLTDQSLFTSTSPHEIGHSLGLYHNHETRNIMSTTLDKELRQFFNHEQEEKLKRKIDRINSNKSH